MAQQAQASGPSTGAFLAATGLAGIAGWVDAVAYLELHAFVANMTGAVVMLGLSAADQDGSGVLRHATTLLGFFSGVVLSRLVRRLGWGPAPSYALAALTVAAPMVAACMGLPDPGQAGVAVLAVAMGLQNAAGTVFGGVGLNTVFLTGNLQRLGETLTDPAKPGGRRGFALGLLPSVLLAYAAGAGAAGLAVRYLALPLLPAVLALAAAAGIALLRARPSRAPQPEARSSPAAAPPTLVPEITAAVPAGRTQPR